MKVAFARRFLPQSLFGRTVLILLIGMLASHAISIWVANGAREQAVRAVGGFVAAQRIANLSRLIEEAPPDWRPRLVEALSDPTFRVSLSSTAPDWRTAAGQSAAATIRDSIAGQLPQWSGREVRVSVVGRIRTPGPGLSNPMFPHGARVGVRDMMQGMMGPAFDGGFGVWRSMRATVRLGDGQWLSFTTALPQTGPPFSWSFWMTFAVMGLLVVAVSAWAVRSVTAPMETFAAAADRLGRDVTAPPLPERGAREIRAATRAFNRMQKRVRRLVEGRTQMLAAISHDLRTPLTLLRLRAEEVEDTSERQKMLATISEMDAMISSMLAFARDDMHGEPRRRTDLVALVESLVDDMADAGMDVRMEPSTPLPVECQPAAIRRVVANVLDNAIKYGGRAEVKVVRTPDAVNVIVEDAGPGIPPDEMDRVFQPFYRVENSRNRETGGTGLGLAISQSIIQAHGGDITLANRTGGGLRVIIGLPA